MTRQLQAWPVLALIVISATAIAQTDSALGHKMLHTRDYPFRYYLDARASNPGGIALSQVEAATTAAFQTWENVACAYPDFQYMGFSTTNPSIVDVRDTNDAFNVSTIWVTSTNDPYYTLALAGGRVPSGSVPLTYAGYLYQCDIFINAVDFQWTTLPNAGGNFRDLQTALTHEVGHCLGLADVASPSTAVMYPEFPVGTSRRTLETQDVQQVCEYYPENGAVGSPCATSDPCTNGLSCIPFLAADNTTVLYRYCSKGCPGLGPGECPNPFVCQNSSAIPGSSKACLAVPHQAVTQVGRPCNSNPECGSAVGICQPPVALPSGGTAWVDGYCYQSCNADSTVTSCPGGSVCVNTSNAPGNNDRCFKRCRPGTGDCRPGYTCSPLPEGNVCVPNCYADADCNADTSSNFTCRVCDRVCVENRPGGLSVGEPCTSSRQCGVGQVCLFVNDHPQGVCAQPCSTAACGCPQGTTCHNVGRDLMCMKDCMAGTCSQPLECNPLGTGYSCLPACRTASDCPTGFSCMNGRCESPPPPTDGGCTDCTDGGTPPPDGGCTSCSDGGTPPPTDGGCTDCTDGGAPPPTDGGCTNCSDGGSPPPPPADAGCTDCMDAGTPPPPPPPTDGGMGGDPGQPHGCGCSASPASAWVFFAALTMLFLARGRRWHRR